MTEQLATLSTVERDHDVDDDVDACKRPHKTHQKLGTYLPLLLYATK